MNASGYMYGGQRTTLWSQILNSGHQASWQALLPNEPSCWTRNLTLHMRENNKNIAIYMDPCSQTSIRIFKVKDKIFLFQKEASEKYNVKKTK